MNTIEKNLSPECMPQISQESYRFECLDENDYSVNREQNIEKSEYEIPKEEF